MIRVMTFKPPPSLQRAFPYLRPQEVDELFYREAYKLELLLADNGHLDHISTLAGVLNMGMGVAWVKRDQRLTNEVNAAYNVLLEAAQSTPPLIAEQDKDPMRKLFWKIEQIFRRTPRKVLVKAMQHVDHILANEPARVVHLDKGLEEGPCT